MIRSDLVALSSPDRIQAFVGAYRRSIFKHRSSQSAGRPNSAKQISIDTKLWRRPGKRSVRNSYGKRVCAKPNTRKQIDC